jgi:hypothetical protein
MHGHSLALYIVDLVHLVVVVVVVVVAMVMA